MKHVNKYSYTLIFAFLLAVLTVVGFSFDTEGAFFELPAGKVVWLLRVVHILLFTFLYYALLRLLFSLLDRSRLSLPASPKILVRHPLLLSALVIAICWLPWLVVFWPGGLFNDALWQIYHFEEGTLGMQHPKLTTLIIGGLFRLGHHFSPEIGVFFVTSITTVLNFTAYLAILRRMQQWGVSKWIVLLAAAFFGIVPYYVAMADYAVKDSFYVPLFVFYFLTLLRLLETRTAPHLKDVAEFVVFSVALTMFRNEAVFVVAPLLVILIPVLLGKAARMKALVGLVSFLVAYGALLQTGFTQFGQVEGKISLESQNIRIQQIGRFVANHPEAVTDAEMRLLTEMLPYSDSDTPLGERYNPVCSDPLKGFSVLISKDQMAEFRTITSAFWERHPETMIDATLHHTYLYWYPFSLKYTKNTGWLMIDGNRTVETYVGFEKGWLEQYSALYEWYGFPSQVFSADWRTAFIDYAIKLSSSPFLSLASNPASALWVTVFCLTFLLRKRRFAAAVACVPLLLVMALCMASPVNGYIRYAIPTMACAPLLLVYSICIVRRHCRACADCGESQNAI